MDRNDKVAGSILGLIIGDIMAHPFKNMIFDERKEYFPVNDFVEPFNLDELLKCSDPRINDLKAKL